MWFANGIATHITSCSKHELNILHNYLTKQVEHFNLHLKDSYESAVRISIGIMLKQDAPRNFKLQLKRGMRGVYKTWLTRRICRSFHTFTPMSLVARWEFPRQFRTLHCDCNKVYKNNMAKFLAQRLMSCAANKISSQQRQTSMQLKRP